MPASKRSTCQASARVIMPCHACSHVKFEHLFSARERIEALFQSAQYSWSAAPGHRGEAARAARKCLSHSRWAEVSAKASGSPRQPTAMIALTSGGGLVGDPESGAARDAVLPAASPEVVREASWGAMRSSPGGRHEWNRWWCWRHEERREGRQDGRYARWRSWPRRSWWRQPWRGGPGGPRRYIF
jgi:hypothetical protein